MEGAEGSGRFFKNLVGFYFRAVTLNEKTKI